MFTSKRTEYDRSSNDLYSKNGKLRSEVPGLLLSQSEPVLLCARVRIHPSDSVIKFEQRAFLQPQGLPNEVKQPESTGTHAGAHAAANAVPQAIDPNLIAKFNKKFGNQQVCAGYALK